MKKVILLVIIAGAAALGFFLLNQGLGQLVKQQMVRQGTQLTNTEVAVRRVNIRTGKASGEIKGFRLANPEGYTDPDAFKLDRILLDIDFPSLAGSPKRLNAFVLERPEVFLEVTDDNRTNLLELAESIAQNLPEKSGTSDPASEEENPYADTRFAIDSLRITGARMTIRHRRLGKEPRVLTLPDIIIDDLGGREGVTGGRVAIPILKELAKQGLKEALKSEAATRAVDFLKEKLAPEE